MHKRKSIQVDEATWRALRLKALDAGCSVGRVVAELVNDGPPSVEGNIAGGTVVVKGSSAYVLTGAPVKELRYVPDDAS